MSGSEERDVPNSSEAESSAKDEKETAPGADELPAATVEKSLEPGGDTSATSDSCYKYDENGIMIYTDPTTKTEYVLDPSGSNWIPRSESESKYDFDGKTYLYTDEKTGIKHRWDLEKQSWAKVSEGEQQEEKEESEEKAEKKANDDKEEEEESEEDDSTTDADRKEKMYRKRKALAGWGSSGTYSVDPDTGAHLYKDSNDGMIYEWDTAKNAWFPRIDEDFMAVYQLNYGFTSDGQPEPTQPTASTEEEDKQAEEAKKPKKEEGKKKPQWFQEDEQKTTKVYVSHLPEDITEEGFLELMSKCGVVDIDPRSNKPKIKIYRDENGVPKGDALCTYVKVESVQLALTIIDGSTIHSKTGKPTVVSVERAKFEMKGSAYDPTKKPKKLGKKELEKVQKRKDKLLAWIPDQVRGIRKKSDKVIVIENVFSIKDFDQDASLILECSSKLREHCSKFGAVTKVVVYDKNPAGICQVFFKTPEEADVAISMLNGRLFTKACGPMNCYTWDGKTKYKVTESEEEEKARLANWEKFLKADDDDDGGGGPTTDKN